MNLCYIIICSVTILFSKKMTCINSFNTLDNTRRHGHMSNFDINKTNHNNAIKNLNALEA